ncbi:MAG: hypothetical protein NZZ41_02700 [Candidatus Dojkabacteria bacterium]|nr:hypothetical protein [Candidatus Dojkabacteria bacterium]
MSLIDNAFKNNADFKLGYEVALIESYLIKKIKFGVKLTPKNEKYLIELANHFNSIYFIDKENGYINVIGYINLN